MHRCHPFYVRCSYFSLLFGLQPWNWHTLKTTKVMQYLKLYISSKILYICFCCEYIVEMKSASVWFVCVLGIVSTAKRIMWIWCIKHTRLILYSIIVMHVVSNCAWFQIFHAIWCSTRAHCTALSCVQMNCIIEATIKPTAPPIRISRSWTKKYNWICDLIVCLFVCQN